MQVSHFRLESEIGRGGNGVVYRAVDVADPAFRVAVKLVHPSLSGDNGFLEALRRESRVLAGLAHRNIVQFRDLVVEQGNAALILELLEGEPLSETLKRGPLKVDDVRRMTESVLGALAYTHQLRPPVAHRDLKPENLFVTADGEIKTLDFGLARAVESATSSKTGNLSGTADFMAPEVWNGQPTSTTGDIYAFGLIVWEMCTGRRACIEGNPMQKMAWHAQGVLPDVRTIRPDVPAALADWIRALTDRDLARRPATGAAALAAYHAAGLSTERPPAPPPAPPAPPPPQPVPPVPPAPSASRMWIVAAVGVVAVLLLAMCGGGSTMVWALMPSGDDVVAPVAPVVPTAVVGPTACSDAGATGAYRDAAVAWDQCSWTQAADLYGGATAVQAPAAVGLCATQRSALVAPRRADLSGIEQDVTEGKCHLALAELAKLDGMQPSAACHGVLTTCEAKELADRQAEAEASERKLRELVDGTVITSINFRQVPGDPWTWDIAVGGEWEMFFALAAAASTADDGDTSAVLTMATYFVGVTGAVGAVSQETKWHSRTLYFEDHGSCVRKVSTSTSRDIARRLKKAMARDDLLETLTAIQWALEHVQSC